MFRVKGFKELQHYKDRSPPWIKLYNRVLDDYEFACLQDASKLHLIMIWLLASRSDNLLPADPEWIGKRINATNPVDLETLIKHGFLVVEQDASNALADCKQDACLERERETDSRRGDESPREMVWRIGVDMMGEASRPLLGKLCKAHGEDSVAHVLASMALKPPADPKAYLVKALAGEERPAWR